MTADGHSPGFRPLLGLPFGADLNLPYRDAFAIEPEEKFSERTSTPIKAVVQRLHGWAVFRSLADIGGY
jgi:hypothetical protein